MTVKLKKLLLTISARALVLLQQWYQLAKSEVQSASSGGFLTWILFMHLVHFNLAWVSDSVFSNLKRSRNSATLKCRNVSSLLSTTVELKAFLCACLWNIFSSIVPVYKTFNQFNFNCHNFNHASPIKKNLLTAKNL